MLTIAQQPRVLATAISNHTRSTTSLFDLLTDLNDGMDDTEAALIPATLMDFSHTHHMRFLNVPQEHRIICG